MGATSPALFSRLLSPSTIGPAIAGVKTGQGVKNFLSPDIPDPSLPEEERDTDADAAAAAERERRRRNRARGRGQSILSSSPLGVPGGRVGVSSLGGA